MESLLQKQDLLETQIAAHGETIAAISSTALKVVSSVHVCCCIILEGGHR